MTPEQEQRLREIEKQLRQARPPYDLIPCCEGDCTRVFIGVRGDAGACDCGGFRREDAELMTQAPEHLRLLLSLLREREEENHRLRALLERALIGAWHEACGGHEDPGPTWHCCDWRELAEEIDAALRGESAATPLEEENRRLRERVAHYENGLRRLLEELKPRV